MKVSLWARVHNRRGRIVSSYDTISCKHLRWWFPHMHTKIIILILYKLHFGTCGKWRFCERSDSSSESEIMVELVCITVFCIHFQYGAGNFCPSSLVMAFLSLQLWAIVHLVSMNTRLDFKLHYFYSFI